MKHNPLSRNASPRPLFALSLALILIGAFLLLRGCEIAAPAAV